MEPIPLDALELTRWWWRHPEGSKSLYHPQGYEGLTSDDRVTELYCLSVIDFDLELFYCFSVRWRPYLNGVTLNGKIPPGMDEVRDHLFIGMETLRAHPDQTEPIFRTAWMGQPHRTFDETSSTYREVMNAFMNFIDNE
jgi:hypothetical protein